jgi:tRNA pseudouridine55 synthase
MQNLLTKDVSRREFGMLLIDKPAGITSHDLVAQVRRQLRQRRVGHAGTLDPSATGLLIMGVGRATRLLTFLVGADKTYAATFGLGMATSTDDAAGEVVSVGTTAAVSDAQVREVVASLVGVIQQVPSAISAVKVNGVRAYKRVRAGDDVALPARAVTVHANQIHEIRREFTDGVESLELDCTVRVSSGTYVRALARDMGEELGCGGHLVALRRTDVGPFSIAEAYQGLSRGGRDAGMDFESANALEMSLLSPAEIARRVLPSEIVSGQEASYICTGRRIAATKEQGPTALFDSTGHLMAVASATGGVWRYSAVFGSVRQPEPRLASCE